MSISKCLEGKGQRLAFGVQFCASFFVYFRLESKLFFCSCIFFIFCLIFFLYISPWRASYFVAVFYVCFLKSFCIFPLEEWVILLPRSNFSPFQLQSLLRNTQGAAATTNELFCPFYFGHLKIHTGGKPYKCNRSSSIGDLRKHLKIHTGE